MILKSFPPPQLFCDSMIASLKHPNTGKFLKDFPIAVNAGKMRDFVAW